jgi:hypothetical protein
MVDPQRESVQDLLERGSDSFKFLGPGWVVVVDDDGYGEILAGRIGLRGSLTTKLTGDNRVQRNY